MPRRPRSTAPALALTFLFLAALVLRLARFDERIVIRITTPSGPPPLTFRSGGTYPVEGTADSGGAVYRTVAAVLIELFERNEKVPGGRLSYGSSMASHDPVTGRFTGTVTVPRGERRKPLYIGVEVIDKAGGRHRDTRPGRPHEGGGFPILVE